VSRRTRSSRPASPRLFSSDAIVLRPTGGARLRALALRGGRGPTPSQARDDEDRATMERLRGWGRQLADEFGLRYRALDPESPGVVEHYGICYEDGVIRIRLRHATTGRLLKESSLVDTLCHELAHLRHFDHSERFRRLYQRILDAARRRGIYRPGPGGDGGDRGARQLALTFDAAGCGTAARGEERR
jgi:hypothetical protein